MCDLCGHSCAACPDDDKRQAVDALITNFGKVYLCFVHLAALQQAAIDQCVLD